MTVNQTYNSEDIRSKFLSDILILLKKLPLELFKKVHTNYEINGSLGSISDKIPSHYMGHGVGYHTVHFKDLGVHTLKEHMTLRTDSGQST